MEFILADPALAAPVRSLVRRLPSLVGTPVRIETARGLRDRGGPVHGAAFLRQRRIVLDCVRAEFPRIFVHELYHFAWLRAGNSLRRSYEELLARELRTKARGELGWSAEWRKNKLQKTDVQRRSRRWREYCCESFCDTAAWLYSGLASHREFTLSGRAAGRRRAWFKRNLEGSALSI